MDSQRGNSGSWLGEVFGRGGGSKPAEGTTDREKLKSPTTQEGFARPPHHTIAGEVKVKPLKRAVVKKKKD